MARKRLTDLPSEIRQQIFEECLKVDGGYAYNAQTDKLTNADQARTPIDLSLRYTCRSIARDTATIPLAVNTIYFSTSDDRRSLAGCFNLVATAYYILEQDFVFHLAEFITPEMFAQIDAKFPRFRSMFESELAIHDICNPVRDRPRSTTELVNRIRPSSCRWVESFFRQNVDNPDVYGPFAYVSFASIHEQDFMNPSGSLPGDSHDRWQQQSGDVRDALSYCLRLIAKEAPREFNNQVHKTLPHWVGKYHPQEFLGLKFNLWDIPSREDVAHALDLLHIHDFAWKLPELWTYPHQFYRELGDPVEPRPENAERCQYDAEYENPTRLVDRFDYRYRHKIRFSAAATAIRFMSRLPAEQRTQIRRIILHEDSPSVNMPSLHAQGLVPLYQENPLLQVERRVSVFGCIHSWAGPEKEWMTRDKPRSLYGPTFLLTLESWLIDALSVRDLDIPSGSFIFNLWGGSYGDLCTEVFQGCIHMALAEGPAFDKCCELDLFSSTTNQLSATPDKFFLDPRFREAVKHLVNKTSILRSDFHPGVPVDPNVLVEETKGMDDVGRRISRWDYHGRSFSCKIPADLYYDFILPPQFDFQTREQYIESRGGRVNGQDS
ncbi:uncharacterized protein FFUJ_05557 [Fusarium fujikuroi IMI 58289]|uniref:Uncharacterized protein n=1 Tax=Gibberella fujikuroi (strain CBS 195.34 / IMI 58289 / NRRL A-6831) TaxID=1279085 RepID=S0EB29_GIBF5|nr:uncharacterized protein FFUJ_05557 [Fusarium fujikuroi IMI 58289]CCT69653.1 uncharacterized protein FFUJ_05557 [Fusarium fujikuroi IMI 58289]SCO26970.1 uncharacterized protein FFM5_15239 [Fusarium fujikuroi]